MAMFDSIDDLMDRITQIDPDARSNYPVLSNPIFYLVMEYLYQTQDVSDTVDFLASFNTAVRQAQESFDIKLISEANITAGTLTSTGLTQLERMFSNINWDFTPSVPGILSGDSYSDSTDLTLSPKRWIIEQYQYDETKFYLMSNTALFVQLANDIRNSIQYFMPKYTGYSAAGSDTDSRYLSEVESQTKVYGISDDTVYQLMASAESQMADLLSDVDRLDNRLDDYDDDYIEYYLAQSKSAATETPGGSDAANAATQVALLSSVTSALGAVTIGNDEPDMSDLSISSAIDASVSIPLLLCSVTRDYLSCVAIETSSFDSVINGILMPLEAENFTIDDVLDAIFGNTGGRDGRILLEDSSESDLYDIPLAGEAGVKGSIYDKVVSLTGYEAIDDTIPILGFDRYSVYSTGTSYVTGKQVLIDYLLDSSQPNFLNANRLKTYSERLFYKTNSARSLVNQLIFGSGGITSTNITSAKLFEMTIKKLQSAVDTFLSGFDGTDFGTSVSLSESRDSDDAPRAFEIWCLMAARENDAVDEALFNYLLVRSCYARGISVNSDGKTSSDETNPSDRLKLQFILAAINLRNVLHEEYDFGTTGMISLGENSPVDDVPFEKFENYDDEYFYPGKLMSAGSDPFRLDSDNIDENEGLITYFFDNTIGEEGVKTPGSIFNVIHETVTSFQQLRLDHYGVGAIGPDEDTGTKEGTHTERTTRGKGFPRAAREYAVYTLVKDLLKNLSAAYIVKTIGDDDMSSEDRPDFIYIDPQKFGVLADAAGILATFDSTDDWDLSGVANSELADEIDRMSAYEKSIMTSWGQEERERIAAMYSLILSQDAALLGGLYQLMGITALQVEASGNLDSALQALSGVDSSVTDFLSNSEVSSGISETMSTQYIQTCRYLKEVLFNQHYTYSHLPSGKCFDSNQISCMINFLSGEDFIPETSDHEDFGNSMESGYKLLTVGVPAGLVEYLSYLAFASTGDTQYYMSPYIAIDVYRRNLQDDSETTEPMTFYFDMSRFTVEGINNRDDAGSLSYVGQSRTELYTNIRDSQVIYDENGDLLASDPFSESSSDSEEMGYRVKLKNHHVNDYYLKMYLKVVLGIDIMEDVFQIDQDNDLFTGVDSGKDHLFSDFLETTLPSMESLTDEEQIIEFDKIRKDAARSVIYSSDQYKKRSLFPRTFDRVFCLNVDINNGFEIEESDRATEPADTIAPDQNETKFYQLYCNIRSLSKSLFVSLPEATDSDEDYEYE